ncbi:MULTISPECIES: CHAT domain-containing protein [unclassified Microcoleus]|uniref:CHAT domain-containing protein n=1 Tax=unclassified Microcoleus TaxID=2642155 RepID=UPI0025F36F35|nr:MULTISPECIES: CHAT domain-containing protein [unclassified Microcoleus]
MPFFLSYDRLWQTGKVYKLQCLVVFDLYRIFRKMVLVVLSACNTGEGRITGDGVIGLSRALISAGVPSAIVSLWAVPDAPTSELMQAFYRNLQSNPDKAQALRQAMLTTMKTHPQPRNWAAFTLIGEAE